MKNYTFLLLIFLFFIQFNSQGQSWQNITEKKGGFISSDIVQDNKGNLYVYCPTGVFKSVDNGVTWAKLGKEIFKIINEQTLLINKLFIVHDTLHLFYNKFLNNSSPYVTSVYYDKVNNIWKQSGININTTFAYDLEQNSKIVAYVSTYTGKTFTYSSDGMKTWKSTTVKSNSTISDVFVLNNKFYFFTGDTLNTTINGTDINKNYVPPVSYFSSVSSTNAINTVSNNYIKAVLFSKNSDIKDSLVVLRLDTVNYKWVEINKSKYDGPSNSFYYLSISSNGYLYEIASGRLLDQYKCFNTFRRSKDWGTTWEKLSFQPGAISQDLIFPKIQEIGGKAYLESPGALQNTPDLLSTNFAITAPQNFGYQISESIDYSKNYAGRFLNVDFCKNDFFYERSRWNSSWQQLNNPFQNLTNSLTLTMNDFTKNYILAYDVKIDFTSSSPIKRKYYISKDEGVLWDSLPNPGLKNETLSITEINNVFYAVLPGKKSDTLFVSDNAGKNWSIKKTPVSAFTGTEPFNAVINFSGNDIYLFNSQGSQKKIYTSADQGNNWQDVTFNIPQKNVFDNNFGYSSGYLYKSFAGPVLGISKPLTLGSSGNSNIASYALNKSLSRWDFMDSSYTYNRNHFKMDTTLRTVVKDASKSKYSDIYRTELSFNNSDWHNLDEIVSTLEKGDTLINAIKNNRKGIFAETNYGLFYIPYNSATGLEDLSSSERNEGYVLFPNPASGSFTVLPGGVNVSVQISDVNGKEIQQVSTWKTDQSFDISTLKEGIYYIKIKGQQEKDFKFIKQ